MDEKILNYICEYKTLTDKIPTNIYVDKSLLSAFEPIQIEGTYFDAVIMPLLESTKPMEYHLTQTLLQFGLIRDKSSNLSMVLGPVSLTKFSELDVRNTLITLGLDLDLAPMLTTYFNSMAHLSMEDFIAHMQLLYASINHETINKNDIISVKPDYTINTAVNKSLIKTSESVNLGFKDRHTSYDFESKLLFYIQHGMVNKLKSLSTAEQTDAVGRTSLDQLRHYKNIVIIMNSLAARAAIKGGLNSETSYQIAEIYAMKVELCSNVSELQRISQHLRIDYCARVRDLQYSEINDLTINKAINYISNNITQKITATEIAEYLHISKEYLSSKFKSVTKILMVDFINIQKIKEAEYLLLYTDEALVRISNYLSFSSQSYFQNLFKKHVGCTPAEYRNQKNDHT